MRNGHKAQQIDELSSSAYVERRSDYEERLSYLYSVSKDVVYSVSDHFLPSRKILMALIESPAVLIRFYGPIGEKLEALFGATARVAARFKNGGLPTLIPVFDLTRTVGGVVPFKFVTTMDTLVICEHWGKTTERSWLLTEAPYHASYFQGLLTSLGEPPTFSDHLPQLLIEKAQRLPRRRIVDVDEVLHEMFGEKNLAEFDKLASGALTMKDLFDTIVAIIRRYANDKTHILHSSAVLLEWLISNYEVTAYTGRAKGLIVTRIPRKPDESELKMLLRAAEEEKAEQLHMLEDFILHPTVQRHWVYGYVLFPSWSFAPKIESQKEFGGPGNPRRTWWTCAARANAILMKHNLGCSIEVMGKRSNLWHLVGYREGLFEGNIVEARRKLAQAKEFYAETDYQNALTEAWASVEKCSWFIEPYITIVDCWDSLGYKKLNEEEVKNVLGKLYSRKTTLSNALAVMEKRSGSSRSWKGAEYFENEFHAELNKVTALCESLEAWLEKRTPSEHRRKEFDSFVGLLVKITEKWSDESWQLIYEHPFAHRILQEAKGASPRLQSLSEELFRPLAWRYLAQFIREERWRSIPSGGREPWDWLLKEATSYIRDRSEKEARRHQNSYS
jgi:hypothetical protein